MIDLSTCIWRLPVAVLDFETTGLPEQGGRACEVAAVRFEDGIPVARFSSLINPGVPIPAEASAIHKITDADVAGKPSLPEVASDLLRVCQGAVPCAYSAMFDRHMLHQEISGTECPAFDPSQSWVDPLVIIRDVDKFVSGAGKNKLEVACKRHGVVLEGAHRALADCLATGGLLWALKKRIGDISAGDLIRRCDKRREIQDAEFQAWLAKQPKRESAA
jgi:DNA polymerase-3 subunit epsilon